MRKWVFGGAVAVMLSATPVWAQTMELTVTSAKTSVDQMSGQPVVLIELDAPSATVWAEYTARSVGLVVDVLVDGKIITSPYIQTPIMGGMLQLTAEHQGEAETLAALLSGGEPIVVRQQKKEKVQ